MGGRKCCLDACPSSLPRSNVQGITFHRFPMNAAKRKLWLKQCRVADSLKIAKSTFICSLHFNRDDFQEDKLPKAILKTKAYPTLFPWGTSTTENLDTSGELGDEELKLSEDDGANTSNNDVNIVKSPIKSPAKRSASAEEYITEPAKKVIRKTSDSAILNASMIVTPPKKESDLFKTSPKFDRVQNFTPGTKIEAQDFNKSWHSAKIVEVDSDDREVLVHFEASLKGKTPSNIDEWISMDSSRLRPIQIKTSPVKKMSTFAIGEKCLARWSDCRKFPGTVQALLPENNFEILFDDGYTKIVRGVHMTKIKKGMVTKFSPKLSEPEKLQKAPELVPTPKSIEVPIKLERAPISWESIPEQPEGEWTCHWLNDEPVGQESSLLYSEGRPIKTIVVRDNRLPNGWTKHIFQRSGLLGKWDILLETPSGKVYRSKPEMKQHYEDIGQIFDPAVFDFSLHKRRAKELGLFKYTPDYFATAHIQIHPVRKMKVDSNVEDPVPTTNTSSIVVEKKEVLNEDFIMLGSVKVKIIENLLRCPGCDKNFRKENHLQIHIKHYHKELSEYLGVCPNMTDLAYLRTVGNSSSEETLPKNHLPNKQFFEKVHQHDLMAKTSRKSHSFTLHGETSHSDGGPIDTSDSKMPKGFLSTPLSSRDQNKGEINLDEAKKKFTRLEEALNAEPISENSVNPITSSSIQTLKMEESVSQNITKLTPDLKSDITDPELLIKSHSVSKPSSSFKINSKFGVGVRKKVPKLRTNISKLRLKPTQQRLDPPTALNESFTEYDDTRHSFGGSLDVAFKRQKLANQSMFADSGQDTNSQNNSSLIETSQSPKYINEDGEVIKIVRMRQEEIINCICTFPEEDGLMIQCELCLCWQHGVCNGIERESEVPEKYICYICRNPTKGRNSLKYKHDQEWLYEGRLPTLIKQENLKRENRYHLLKESHTLSGNLLELKGFLHSLKVKINIAEKKDHPKMYLWSKKWETSPVRSSEISGISPLGNVRIKQYNDEHMKKEDCKSEVYSNLMQSPCDLIKESLSPKVEHLEHQAHPMPNIPQPEAAIDPAECQLRLLEHIQKQQNAAMLRLQAIEDQLTKIESVDETSDKLENENFSRTKQTIQMLIRDLSTMRKISSTNCSDMYGGLYKIV